MKLRIKGALFHCGRCRKSYSSPFGHVCVSRLDRKAPTGRTRLAPSLTASAGKCGKCHKPMGNPLTHVCTTRTDFKKRTAAKKKADAAAKRKRQPPHLYEVCQGQDDCQRPACRAFKEGHDEGYEVARAEWYPIGYGDGRADCAATHEG